MLSSFHTEMSLQRPQNKDGERLLHVRRLLTAATLAAALVAYFASSCLSSPLLRIQLALLGPLFSSHVNAVAPSPVVFVAARVAPPVPSGPFACDGATHMARVSHTIPSFSAGGPSCLTVSANRCTRLSPQAPTSLKSARHHRNQRGAGAYANEQSATEAAISRVCDGHRSRQTEEAGGTVPAALAIIRCYPVEVAST